MLKSKFKSLVSFLCILITLSLLLPSTVNGEAGMTLKDKLRQQATARTEVKAVKNEDPYYSEVLQTYGTKGYKPANNQKIVIDASKPTASSNGDIPVKTGIGGNSAPVLEWKDTYDWFEWVVDIPADGLYEVDAEYYPLPGMGGMIQRSFAIDGKVPFLEAYNIGFYRFWADEGEPRVNDIGYEIRPRQLEAPKWSAISLVDNQGFYSRPFQFYFSKGKHTIKMNYVDEPAAFKSLTLKTPEVLPTYEQVKAQYAQKGYKDASKTIKFQAETNALYKSDATIRREFDPDPVTEPYTSGGRKLNVLGGARWKRGSQSITWKMNVEEDGLYRLDMRSLQSWNDGLPSQRQIMIDGKVPFAEMDNYSFVFERGWRLETLEDSNDNPYLFYLTKGEHTLSMKVVLGQITDVVHELIEDTLTISEMYRRIIMITSTNPDPNYEYELDQNIPGLLDNMKKVADSLGKQAKILNSMSSKRQNIASNFLGYQQQLNKMVAKPDTISTNLNTLYNAQTGIGNNILSLQNQQLEIDYFLAGPSNMKKVVATSNFFQKAYVTFQNFIRSFYTDYNDVGNYGDGSTVNTVLNVWVGRGKEWAELMKQMADEEFTKKTGIGINMNILPAGQLNAGHTNALLLAITAGKAPDLATGLDVSSPVEFAIRDQVYDMNQFPDYNQVVERFYPQTLVPFRYRGGNFALPENLDFRVMLYRKDILNELGIKVPNTWDEVYNDILPVLNQNNMDVEPYGFANFLYQMGGEYYTKDGMMSALDTPVAIQAFNKWADQFVSLGLPVNYSAFNRFRTGEMPIQFGGYGEYIKLVSAAPELFGRWDIGLIPGTKQADGTIDRSYMGIAGSNATILKNTKHPDEAWEFLKWWTSADVQTRFGREVEASIGVEARWNTSNKAAFGSLPWAKEHKNVILGELEWGKEAPQVLGGYYNGRMVGNAEGRVQNGNMEPRDSLEKAVKDINKELKAKQEEYGVY